MMDLVPSFFFGLEIWQSKRGLFVSQQQYVQELLEAFDMTWCMFVSNPMAPNIKLSNYDPFKHADVSVYMRLVGLMIWLLSTRFDLSFPVGYLSSSSPNTLASRFAYPMLPTRCLSAWPLLSNQRSLRHCSWMK